MLKSVFLLVATLSVLLVSSGGCGSNVIVKGEVAHKTVTGVKDGATYTILVNRPGDGSPWIQVKDTDYEEYFSTEAENAIITESLEELMKQKYSEVTYFVNVEPIFEQEGTQPYKTSRDIFNEMRVGSEVRFRTSGGELPEITEVLEKLDTVKTGVLQGTVIIGPIWPVEPPSGGPPIPPEVYEARKVVVYDESGTEVVRIVDINPGEEYGNYRVELKPGTYVVDINHVGIDNSGDVPRRIEVRPGQIVKINIVIDTGIR